MRKYLLVAAFVIASCISIILMVSPNVSPARDARSHDHPSSVGVPARAHAQTWLAPIPTTKSAASDAHHTAPKFMLTQFNNMHSVRAFYWKAIQHPEKCGYFYAITAINRCMLLQKYITQKEADSTAQIIAKADIASLCDMSTESEYADALRTLGQT